jgi:ABC-type lipoprotein release transport system permease subunit
VAFDKLSTKWVNESSRNPLILVGIAILLIAAAACASYMPARCAAAVDPMEALRYE